MAFVGLTACACPSEEEQALSGDLHETSPVAIDDPYDGGAPLQVADGCADGIAAADEYCFVRVPVPMFDFESFEIAVLDVDGDGRHELLASGPLADSPPGQPIPAWMALGYSRGAFSVLHRSEERGLPLTNPASTAYDWTGDGRADIALFSGASWAAAVTVVPVMESGLGSVEDRQIIPNLMANGVPIPLDVEDDGRPELLVVWGGTDGTEVPDGPGAQLLHGSGLDWDGVGPVFPLPGCGSIEYYAHADFDEDGVLDVAAGESGMSCDPYPAEYDPEWHRVHVFVSRPDIGEVDLVASIPLGAKTNVDNLRAFAADFDRDGHADIVVATVPAGADGTMIPDDAIASYLRGHGDGTFEEPLLLQRLEGEVGGEGWWAPREAGDFDGDSTTELLYTNGSQWGSALTPVPETGVVGLGSAGPTDVSKIIGVAGRIWGVGDLNGDAVADFLTTDPRLRQPGDPEVVVAFVSNP